MPKTVVSHFGLDQSKFDATGAFNSFLDVDSRIFVDPFLLSNSAAPEFKHAREKMLAYYSDVMRLLLASKSVDDVAWRSAAKRLTFREISGFGFGYASKDTRGSGIGAKTRARIMQTAKEIVDRGVRDPVLFELLGLFEDGIGCDRISDMVCSILVSEFAAFSERVFLESGWAEQPSEVVRVEIAKLPKHPFSKRMPVLLAPKDILRELPTSFDYDDIGYVFAVNEDLRQKVNQEIGKNWRATYEDSLKKKPGVKDFFVQHPDLLSAFIERYKKSNPRAYDLEADPAGEYSWFAAAVQATKQNPLLLQLSKTPTLDEVHGVVVKICEKFRTLVEDNGLFRLLYRDSQCQKPKHEDAIQLLFYGVADCYCEANNINLSRESDGGRGPVDFKMSSGYATSVLVEVKKSDNNKLLHAYDKQVPIYEKAERSGRSIILVVQVSESETMIDRLYAHSDKRKKEGKDGPEILTVDGTPKPSASHA